MTITNAAALGAYVDAGKYARGEAPIMAVIRHGETAIAEALAHTTALLDDPHAHRPLVIDVIDVLEEAARSL